MLQEGLFRFLDLPGVQQGGVEREGAGTVLHEPLSGFRIDGVDKGKHGRFERVRPRVGMGCTRSTVIRQEDPRRADQNELTGQDRAIVIDGRTAEARAPEGIFQSLKGQIKDLDLLGVDLGRSQIRTLRSDPCRFNAVSVTLDFGDMKPGFKVANEFAQQIVEIARFIISAFDVGREVGEIQGPAIEKTNRAVVFGSNLLQLGFQSRQFLAQGNGFRGNPISKFGQFSNRHFQLVLDVGGRRIESDLIGLSDGGKRQEGSHEERSKVAMHQSDLLSRYEWEARRTPQARCSAKWQ